MTARQQHNHSLLKLYATLGNMDNAKLQWYQDQHSERWVNRMARRKARIRRAHERWKRWEARFAK